MYTFTKEQREAIHEIGLRGDDMDVYPVGGGAVEVVLWRDDDGFPVVSCSVSVGGTVRVEFEAAT